jgi:hypothetical protein
LFLCVFLALFSLEFQILYFIGVIEVCMRYILFCNISYIYIYIHILCCSKNDFHFVKDIIHVLQLLRAILQIIL